MSRFQRVDWHGHVGIDLRLAHTRERLKLGTLEDPGEEPI